VPAYLEKFEPEEGLYENIEKHVLTKGSFLYEEPEFLLRQELREPSTYMSILESMALGSTTVTEVANDIGREASGLSRYLKNLKELGIVEKVTPVTADASSRGVYEVTDNFFKFWFRFVYPKLNSLERGATRECRRSVESGMDEYVSWIFEEVCREAVYKEDFNFEATDVGRWWYKEEEIDVVALNEESDEILFGECKWTNSPVCEGVVRGLEEKKDEVRWRGGDRTEKFVLFSKSGFEDGLSERLDEGWRLYGLDELKEAFGGQLT
jgi:AAA+ ATPase superfamily predicted ATPase